LHLVGQYLFSQTPTTMAFDFFDPQNRPEEEPDESNDYNGGSSHQEQEWDDQDDYYNHYGSSGEKYGWYNGWSDDVIDDAFEGDPENTWNVD
jgi:hypothetical protein